MILGGIGASIMTVVSIVFAILLMTLTLASMQFSPRAPLPFACDPPAVPRRTVTATGRNSCSRLALFVSLHSPDGTNLLALLDEAGIHWCTASDSMEVQAELRVNERRLSSSMPKVADDRFFGNHNSTSQVRLMNRDAVHALWFSIDAPDASTISLATDKVV